jgi:hypothetical protein
MNAATPTLIALGLESNGNLFAMGALTFRELHASNADLWSIARANGWTDAVEALLG